jgi:hypothetical protein
LPDSNGFIAWSSFTGTREDSRTFALVSGGITRLGIPKRAFRSRQEAAAFRDEAARRIEAARPSDSV